MHAGGRYEVWVLVCSGMVGIDSYRRPDYEERIATMSDDKEAALDYMRRLLAYVWEEPNRTQPTTKLAPVMCAWMVDTDPSVRREFNNTFDPPEQPPFPPTMSLDALQEKYRNPDPAVCDDCKQAWCVCSAKNMQDKLSSMDDEDDSQ